MARPPLAELLASEAHAVLGALGADGRAAATHPFDDVEERRTWAYWPTDRRGVPLHDLDRTATKAVHRLLGVLLPPAAFARVVAIMGLDEVLDRSEGHASDRRHRDDYWITVFGKPGAAAWACRFEGHHVSLHATVVAGAVQLTPLFLGANPATVVDGGRVVSAPLAPEEALGFELLHSLSVEQRTSAIVADQAPDDILSRNDPAVDLASFSGGLPVAALGGEAASAARALLDVYLRRFPPGAHAPDPTGATFAWSGATEPGTGHHYRLVAPRLLVELDNTQNGANHVHTVVRDPTSDFGGDALAAHRRDAH